MQKRQTSFYRRCVLSFAYHGLLNFLPDKVYLKTMYKAKTGQKLDLKSPRSFNEKLQWLKLHDRKPIYTTMVDKYSVKDYVASIIGKEYIIPTLGVWDTFDDIDFGALPNKFVLKCTNDSGGLIICKDKKELDLKRAKRKIEKSLNTNYYYLGREWPYKNVKPRIIAEKYMEDSSIIKEQNDKGRFDDFYGKPKITQHENAQIIIRDKKPLNDYKIYTFNGKARFCMINQDRGTHTRADYFDREYNWLDFTWGYDHADVRPSKPKNYERMFELAERLAVGTVELRVDFYEVDGHVFFGELTFFDGSGFDKIDPIEWDYKLGSLLTLPGERD